MMRRSERLHKNWSRRPFESKEITYRILCLFSALLDLASQAIAAARVHSCLVSINENVNKGGAEKKLRSGLLLQEDLVW